MANTLAEHHASITVNAPVHQVYGMFSHFNDFPKFMSFVKEVTYYDDQRSHWVAETMGQHEWDAVNENWVEDQQICWRSYNGFENSGKVTFQPVGNNQTRVDVYVNYNPPAGVLGDAAENLGVGSRFDNALQHDLDNFAKMVDQAPPGALDPTASNYLFHGGSAAAKDTTTDRQDATMDDQYTNAPMAGDTYGTGSSYNRDVPYTGTTTTDRPIMDRDIINEPTNPASYATGQGSWTETDTVMPPEGTSPGTRNPVMPSNTDNPNPVMPPEDTTNTSY